MTCTLHFVGASDTAVPDSQPTAFGCWQRIRQGPVCTCFRLSHTLTWLSTCKGRALGFCPGTSSKREIAWGGVVGPQQPRGRSGQAASAEAALLLLLASRALRRVLWALQILLIACVGRAESAIATWLCTAVPRLLLACPPACVSFPWHWLPCGLWTYRASLFLLSYRHAMSMHTALPPVIHARVPA